MNKEAALEKILDINNRYENEISTIKDKRSKFFSPEKIEDEKNY